jgi:hypothetical protein
MTHDHAYTNEDSSIDFNNDIAFACGSGIINVSVNATVRWAVYKSR